MKEKLGKEQKGITLVALVITIVVLLILAGVVLNAMQENGIIGKSKLAKEEYDEGLIYENQTLKNYEAVFQEVKSTGTGLGFITSENRLYENNSIYLSINKDSIDFAGNESSYIIFEDTCTLSGLTYIPNGTYYMVGSEGNPECAVLLSENVAIFLGQGYKSIDDIKQAVSNFDNEENASFYVLNYTNS